MSDQLLSREKSVSLNLPLDSMAGISADTEQIRIALDSGGDLTLDVNKQYHDVNGQPAVGQLYRDTNTGNLLSGHSACRCRGCFRHFNISLCSEIKEAVQSESAADDIETDPASPAVQALAKVITELQPASGFCPDCMRKQRIKRFVKAFLSFFTKPLTEVVGHAETEKKPERIVIVPVPMSQPRDYRNRSNGAASRGMISAPGANAEPGFARHNRGGIRT